VHLRHTPYRKDWHDIIFFADNGTDIPTSKAKALERLFMREDFRRARIEEVGHIDFPVRILETYREDFLKSVDLDVIKKAEFKIVVDYANGGAVDIFPAIFGELGCEVISLNAYIDPTKVSISHEEKQLAMNTLSVIVKSLGAELGIMLDNNAEKIRVVDLNGEEVSDELLLLLVTDLFLSTFQARKIAVPVVASMGVEEIAEQFGVEVIRVRNDHQAMMQAHTELQVDFVGGTRGGFIFPGFQPGADAMFASVKILELMAKSGKNLSDLRGKYADLNMRREDVPCNWRKKGQVMRNLIEQTAGEKRQLIDGIRILRDGAWVLIAPDRIKDLFHIYAEARSKEKTLALIEEFKDKIRKMQK